MNNNHFSKNNLGDKGAQFLGSSFEKMNNLTNLTLNLW